MKKHYVTFVSPGTFMAETTTKPIDSWDRATACEMSTQIVERYGAKPYGFYFSTYTEAPDVPDGAGGTLKVQPREDAKTALHFLGGTILNVDEVEARNDPKEGILRSNMRCNGMWFVIQNTNSFLSTLPFEREHVVVDASGAIVERGDSPERAAYRAKKDAERDAAFEREWGKP